jgi:hypothetical protein
VTSTAGTLVELFADLHGGKWGESVKALEGGPAYARIMQRLATHGGLMNGVDAFRTVAGRIADLLRLDLGVILVGGWKKMAELQRYTDRGKYSPDETVLVEITRHTVTSTHKPSLDIVVDEVKIDTLPFELKFTLTLDGALLTIRDGKILAVSPGACKGEGELKCEGYTILKRDSAPVRVPGTWTFKDPIEIPPPHLGTGPTASRSRTASSAPTIAPVE